MLLLRILTIAAFTCFASTFAISITPLSPVLKRSTIHTAKVSTTALEQQVRKEFRFLQLKYSEKIDIHSTQVQENGGGMMKKRAAAAAAKSVPPPVVSQRQVGITALRPNNRMIGWSAPYQIYNGKTLNLLFDSGSSLTVSIGSLCNSKEE